MRDIDAILVDDDVWTRDRWSRMFRKHGKKLVTFRSPDEFRLYLQGHPESVPIFLNFKYSNSDMNGVEAARVAQEMGFIRVFISSNSLSHKMTFPPFIKGVIGKKPSRRWVTKH